MSPLAIRLTIAVPNIQCLVDSGAVYSLIPRSVLERLGIASHSERDFVLANGDVIRRHLATATFEYNGLRGDSMVVVGEPGDDPLLAPRLWRGSAWSSIRFAASCGRCRCH